MRVGCVSGSVHPQTSLSTCARRRIPIDARMRRGFVPMKDKSTAVRVFQYVFGLWGSCARVLCFPTFAKGTAAATKKITTPSANNSRIRNNDSDRTRAGETADCGPEETDPDPMEGEVGQLVVKQRRLHPGGGLQPLHEPACREPASEKTQAGATAVGWRDERNAGGGREERQT